MPSASAAFPPFPPALTCALCAPARRDLPLPQGAGARYDRAMALKIEHRLGIRASADRLADLVEHDLPPEMAARLLPEPSALPASPHALGAKR